MYTHGEPSAQLPLQIYRNYIFKDMGYNDLTLSLLCGGCAGVTEVGCVVVVRVGCWGGSASKVLWQGRTYWRYIHDCDWGWDQDLGLKWDWDVGQSARWSVSGQTYE